MENDDTVVYGGITGINMIDISYPNRFEIVMKWIMKGNKSLNCSCIILIALEVIYDSGVDFK